MFEEIFNQIDSSTVFFVLSFLISFTLIHLSLSRVLNKSPQAAGVLAFLVALGVAYGLWYSGFEFEDFLDNIGWDTDLLIPIIYLVILIGIIYLLFKFGLGIMLMMAGIIFSLLSIIAYEKGFMVISGIVLILIGIFFWWRKNRSPKLPKSETSPRNGQSNMQEYYKKLNQERAKRENELKKREEIIQRNANILQKQYNELKKIHKQLRKQSPSPERDREYNEVIRRMRIINQAARKQGINLEQ